MSQDDSAPAVECTIDTQEELPERSLQVRSDLAPQYIGYEESDEGLTVRFDGTGETLTALARFVANELDCCSFAEFNLSVAPPYEETRLVMTGPDGTERMFREEFVTRLDEWSG